jgi:3D (Asp-Asp-Asp) domain-containing protein
MHKEKALKITALALCGLSALWLVSASAAALSWQGYRIDKQPIPFPVREKQSDFVQKGWTIWLQEGEKGYSNKVSAVCSLLGRRLYEKTVLMTGPVKKPKEGVKVTGNSVKKHPITVPQETYAHEVHNVEATAYDPSPESNSVKWAGITALGWRTRYGIAAVDPKVIALRRLIYVDGYGFAWTGDVGGAIKGKRIDLCYNTTEEAFRWGRKKVKVYVLGTKPPSYYAAKKSGQAAPK